MLKNRIKLLKNPKEASLGYMILIGLLGTYGEYEAFYWLSKGGGKASKPEDRAFHELQKLTYENDENDDCGVKRLVDIIQSSTNFLKELAEQEKNLIR
jgi:hypothetical protein